MFIRNWYARIISIAAAQIPIFAKYDKLILRVVPAFAIICGLVFIVIGILMSLNLIFPDVGTTK